MAQSSAKPISKPYYPTRKLTVLALDPSVKDGSGILRTQMEIPNEQLEPGPRGHRVYVVDYDSSKDSFRKPNRLSKEINSIWSLPADPFEKKTDAQLLADPAFYAFMTYGVVMKTLARFEYALGRRLGWGFAGLRVFISDISPARMGNEPSSVVCRMKLWRMRPRMPCWMG